MGAPKSDAIVEKASIKLLNIVASCGGGDENGISGNLNSVVLDPSFYKWNRMFTLQCGFCRHLYHDVGYIITEPTRSLPWKHHLKEPSSVFQVSHQMYPTWAYL